MKHLLMIVFISVITLYGQTTADVIDIEFRAAAVSSIAISITAVQGDGVSCFLTKAAGGKITLSTSCSSADGKTTYNAGVIRSNGTTTSIVALGFGDVLCLLGVNPTASASAMGSLGNVPANGVAWSCSTNIRTAGTITGQSAPVAGSVVWP